MEFKSFIEKMLTSESGVSSKRSSGTIGFAIFIILTTFVVVYDMVDDGALAQFSVTLLTTLNYTSAALLGLGILDKFKKL